MLIVVLKNEYADGILFAVWDVEKANGMTLSEPTLMDMINKGKVKNATVVHKKARAPYIRVSGTYKNYVHKSRMSTGNVKDRQMEAEIKKERQWRASKYDVRKDGLAEQIWNGIQKHKGAKGNDRCGVTHFGLSSKDKANRWALVFGWEDGFDKDEDGSTERFCGKVAYQSTRSAMQCDMMDWEMPYDAKTGEVDDTDVEITAKSDIAWLLEQWVRIRKYKKI